MFIRGCECVYFCVCMCVCNVRIELAQIQLGSLGDCHFLTYEIISERLVTSLS